LGDLVTTDTASAPAIPADPATGPDPSGSRWTNLAPQAVITLTAFVTGAAGIIYEYLLAQTGSLLLGNTGIQFAITISTMILMMGVGGVLQKFITDRFLLTAFISGELLLSLLGGFAPLANYLAFARFGDHFVLIQFFFIVAIGLLIGIEIPVAARLNERYTEKLGSNLAMITGADYVGAFAGGMLWIWLLRNMIPLDVVSYYIAGLNLVVAVMCLGLFWRRGFVTRRRYGLAGIIAIIAVIAALAGGLRFTPSAITWADQDLYDDPVVFKATTPYQHLVVTQRRNPDDTTLYINGNKQFSSTDEAMYHELLVHPAMHLAPHQRVLVLGGGDGLAVRELLKYPDVTDITLVDLDPEMIRLATTNPLLTSLNQNAFHDARVQASGSAGVTRLPETREVHQNTGETDKIDGHPVPKTRRVATVNIHTVDAYNFVRAKSGQVWDIVIVDLPDPSGSELSKLYSLEFYRHIKSHLSPTGLMVVQSGSPYHAREAFVCTWKTIRNSGYTSIPYHMNVPSFGDWGWVMAWKNPTTEAQMRERIAAMGAWQVPTRYLDPAQGAANFQHTLSFGKGWLDDRDIEVSTVLRPTILRYYVEKGWQID
jgi:spermidine synthase